LQTLYGWHVAVAGTTPQPETERQRTRTHTEMTGVCPRYPVRVSVLSCIRYLQPLHIPWYRSRQRHL